MVILEAGGGSISALRVTGDPAKGDPGGEAPRPRPPPPLIYWGDLSVTGNGDLPLATQRRVESILTPLAKIAIFCHPPPSKFCTPPHCLSTASLSVRIASLFSLFSFATFLRLDQTNFSRFRRTLSTGFDCWLCYFRCPFGRTNPIPERSRRRANCAQAFVAGPAVFPLYFQRAVSSE